MQPAQQQPKPLAKDELTEVQDTLAMMESLQLVAQQKLYGNIDLQQLDKEQMDQLLQNMAMYDQQQHDLLTKRLDVAQKLELERIRAKVLHKRTMRYLFIGVCLVVLPIVTLLILFYREQYFIPWLTFLTGILGGVGLSKLNTSPTEPPIQQLLGMKELDE